MLLSKYNITFKIKQYNFIFWLLIKENAWVVQVYAASQCHVMTYDYSAGGSAEIRP